MKARPLAVPARALARADARVPIFAAGILTMTGAGAAVPPWLFAIGHAKALAVRLLSPAPKSHLSVTSPAFENGRAIPCRNTQYCGNAFPGLAWTAGPAGTRSYVVIMQGPGEGPETSIHLTVFNISARVRQLPTGMIDPPAGASLGPNVHGLHHTYAGPHPHGRAHNVYHLQVFALDGRVHPTSPVTFNKLITTMRGHVLASGELVGYAVQPSR